MMDRTQALQVLREWADHDGINAPRADALVELRAWIKDRVDRTITCASCNGSIELPTWQAPDEYRCRGCKVGYVCLPCVYAFGHLDEDHGTGDPELTVLNLRIENEAYREAFEAHSEALRGTH